MKSSKMSEDTYTDGILDTPSQPDHSELIAEIDAWINAPLDKTASLEEYDLLATILLTDAIKALKGD